MCVCVGGGVGGLGWGLGGGAWRASSWISHWWRLTSGSLIDWQVIYVKQKLTLWVPKKTQPGSSSKVSFYFEK